MTEPRNREPVTADERFNDVTGITLDARLDRVHPESVERLRPQFTAFYRAHYPEVARALAVTLGDRDLGGEAADEAMARCYSRWSAVRGYDNPAGWVYRVGLNWARSRLRRAARARPVVESVTVADPPEVADPAVDAALRALPLELRAVVVCRLLFDWSTEVTAEVLDLRPGTVKSRLHRALAKLERKLYHLR